MNRFEYTFNPSLNSSEAAFNSSAFASTAARYTLESTGVRDWSGPGGRSVRMVSLGSTNPFYYKFGGSAVTVGSSDGTLVIGGESVVVPVQPSWSHVAMVSSTTVLAVNVTIGYGR